MKLKQHLKLGKYILSNYDNGYIGNLKINRTAYLIGNIAPDLNCIYPAHRLKTTDKRFYKRLKIIEKSSTPLIRSFMLGIVTHYICDYFCYAHNIESLGVPHKKYETNLYKYYESHLDELVDNSKKLKDLWNKNKLISINKFADNGCMNSEEHCKLVLEQVKLMNIEYAKDIGTKNEHDWFWKSSQMQKDMEYTLFMIFNITDILLEPFKCLIVNVQKS